MSRYYTSSRFRPECPTCGNKIGQLEESFKRLQEQGKTPAEALEALNIMRPCCRRSTLWPVVLPIGAFYLPHHEASMMNYLSLKEAAPQPNLVVLSLRRAVTGENYIVSHVDSEGFIGKIADPNVHEPVQVEISNCLDKTCKIRVQTEPGEITRGFPFETRSFNRGFEVDRVRSYFDLPHEEPVAFDEKPRDLPMIEDVSDDEPLVDTRE